MSANGIGSGLNRRIDRCVKTASPSGIDSRLSFIGSVPSFPRW